MPWWFRRRRRKPVSDNITTTAAHPIHVPGREGTLEAESHYVLPNDLRETNRLDLQHVAMREQFGTNCFAPIQHPAKILDAASGTGRWAKEVAKQFPKVQVTGFDFSVPLEIQEHKSSTAYMFQKVNVLEPLPFPDASFDYVHMRFMFSAMPAKKWPEVVSELVRVTTPLGWIELVEGYLPIEGGPALSQVEAWWRQIFSARGIDLSAASQIGAYLRMSGVVSVTERSGSLPMGPHGGRVGQMVGVDLLSAFQSGIPAISQGLELDQQVIRETIQQVDAEVYSGNYQVRIPIYIAFGQKPA